MPPKGPYRVVTVNGSVDNSKMLVDWVLKDVKDEYTIEWVGNCVSVDEVERHVSELKPDVVFVASSIEPTHSETVHATATAVHPPLKVCIIPYGTQAEKGPQGVVDFVKDQLAHLMP